MSHEQDGRWAMFPDILHDIDGPCWAMFTAAAPPFRPGPLSLPGKGEAGTQGEETKFPVGWLTAAGPALVCLLSALWRMSPQTSLLSLLANTAATRYSSQTAGATQLSQLEAC